MYLFTFEKYQETFNVNDTNHVHEKRSGDYSKRNKNYTNEKLHEILNLAIGQMTQFRNKNEIAITFFNKVGGTNAILCAFEDKDITIITMLENVKRQVNDVFRGANHIFLRDYIFTKPTREDLKEYSLKIVQPKNKLRGKIKKKNPNKIQNKIAKSIDLSDEDKLFIKAMKRK